MTHIKQPLIYNSRIRNMRDFKAAEIEIIKQKN